MQATTNNSLEKMHSLIKSEGYFNSVEGMGNVLFRALVVGMRLSRDAAPLELLPPLS